MGAQDLYKPNSALADGTKNGTVVNASDTIATSGAETAEPIVPSEKDAKGICSPPALALT